MPFIISGINSFKNLVYIRYLNDDLQMFRDREDPCAVYVILKNRLKDNLLKDFHLHNALALASRLYHALPDCYLNARCYVDEVRKVLHSKVGDPTFTRKQGLNIASMLLGLEHQRKFDCYMARIEDSPILKEPFDREIRAKMTFLQKQTLEGPDKYQSLGALSRKNNELLSMYASNKIPTPKPRVEKFTDRRDRKRKREKRSDRERSRKTSTRSKRTKTDRESKTDRVRSKDVVEKKSKAEKGTHGAHISKVSQADLQQIIAFANTVRLN